MLDVFLFFNKNKVFNLFSGKLELYAFRVFSAITVQYWRVKSVVDIADWLSSVLFISATLSEIEILPADKKSRSTPALF